MIRVHWEHSEYISAILKCEFDIKTLHTSKYVWLVWGTGRGGGDKIGA